MNKRDYILIITIILLVLILIAIVRSDGTRLVTLIDYTHYLEAARRIAIRHSPYHNLEYFSPPWFAIVLIPLTYIPVKVSEIFWLILCVLGVFIAVNTWGSHWVYPKLALNRLLIAILFCIAPPSLYTYITGQASAIVLLALTCLLLSLGSSWLTNILMIIGLTIKPHLVIFPVFIHLAESIRKRRDKIVVRTGLSLLFLVGLSTLFYPRWLGEWIQTLMIGDYRGGPGLVSSGYFGYREAGVPIWLLILPVFYTLLIWYKEGQTPYLLCLSIVSNLLIIPYHRAYDHILLYPPSLYILAYAGKSLAGLVARFLFLIAIFLIPFTPLALLSPVFLLIALCVLRIKEKTSSLGSVIDQFFTDLG